MSKAAHTIKDLRTDEGPERRTNTIALANTTERDSFVTVNCFGPAVAGGDVVVGML